VIPARTKLGLRPKAPWKNCHYSGAPVDAREDRLQISNRDPTGGRRNIANFHATEASTLQSCAEL
jgi:hypothetical protein